MDTVAVVLVIVLVVVVLVRGPKTLPSIGAMLGRGVKATKDEARAWRDGDPPADQDGRPPAGPPAG